MGEVIAVDFLKGRPVPPRPARAVLFNDLSLHLLRKMAGQTAALARATSRLSAEVVEAEALRGRKGR